MTPEQFQQIHSMLSELVENRRESLALQREALKTQQLSAETQIGAVQFTKDCQRRSQRLLVVFVGVGLLAIGFLVVAAIFRK